MPSHAKNVKPYKEPVPLFQRHHIEAQLDAMFSATVTLKSGGYIVINQTEALVSIDVNSGRATLRAFDRGDRAQDQPRSRRRSRPPASPARPCGPYRDRFHRHGGQPQRSRRRETHARCGQERPCPAFRSARSASSASWRCPASVCAPASSRVRPCPARIAAARASCVPSRAPALRLLRGLEEEGQKLKASAVVVRVASDVAIYTLNQKRRDARAHRGRLSDGDRLRAEGRSDGRHLRTRAGRSRRRRKKAQSLHPRSRPNSFRPPTRKSRKISSKPTKSRPTRPMRSTRPSPREQQNGSQQPQPQQGVPSSKRRRRRAAGGAVTAAIVRRSHSGQPNHHHHSQPAAQSQPLSEEEHVQAASAGAELSADPAQSTQLPPEGQPGAPAQEAQKAPRQTWRKRERAAWRACRFRPGTHVARQRSRSCRARSGTILSSRDRQTGARSAHRHAERVVHARVVADRRTRRCGFARAGDHFSNRRPASSPGRAVGIRGRGSRAARP